MGPILGSLERVEKYRLQHIYEQLSVLHKLGTIETDAAVSLVRMCADQAIYDSMISREVNLRLFDNTGLLNNPFPWRYIFRLFSKDGNVVLQRIRKSQPILQVNTHQIFPAIRLPFLAFGERLRVIEMVRHPLFVIHHWMRFGADRYGSDPRDFTIWIRDSEGQSVPWFAHGWEAEFRRLCPTDIAIRAVHWLVRERDRVCQQATEEQKRQVLFIPFEHFVTDPWPWLARIEDFLGTRRTSATPKVLKKQRCPRPVLTAGKGHKRSGWQRPGSTATNASEFRLIEGEVEREASPEAFELLRQMCADYERQYPFPFV